MFIQKLLDRPLLYNVMRRSHDANLVRIIEREMTIGQGESILDFGCGPATNTRLFRDSFYTGIDKNPAYITYAKAKFPSKRFILADITRPSGRGEKFDWILANCVFHNLYENEAYCASRELNVLLKDSGKILIIDLLKPGSDNRMGNFMVSMDRGRYPRNLCDYEKLFLRDFRIIKKYALKIWCWDFCVFLLRATDN